MRRTVRDDVLVTLDGASDLHFHDYPDLFPRLGDDFDVALAARDAGMRAILIKGHHESTTSRAYTVGQIVDGLDVFGGIVLNGYVGGLNPSAVDASLRQGGKAVWMPTVDAGFHAEVHGSTGVYAAQSGGLQRADGIWILDEDERLVPAVGEILSLIAEHDAILGTAHLSPREIQALVPAAFAAGVQKVVITHPFYKVPALDLDVLADLVGLGAYAEFEYCGVSPAWQVSRPETIVEAVARLGAERCLLVSDAGQRHNPLGPEALRLLAQTVYEKGVPLEDVDRMIKRNPAELLGLESNDAFAPAARELGGPVLRLIAGTGSVGGIRARAERLLPSREYARAREEITSWPGYEPTPLVELRVLAEGAGVGELWLKDESARLGLGSFKALGGAYAVLQLARRRGHGLTVATATDGNHGRSVAWGAGLAGCECVIYLHATVSRDREQAIQALGARTVRVDGNYDDSVRACADDAERNGWVVVSDTAASTAAGPALDIMQGYRLMVDEAAAQLAARDAWPTHVLVQAGCGGLAAAVAAHLASLDDAQHPMPRFIVVEPETAACLYASARAGHPVVVHGTLETIMAGLAVGEVSAPAWEILRGGEIDFVAIDETGIEPAMRLLAQGGDGQPPVVAGETGAAGLAALLALVEDRGAARALGLDSSSSVLLFNTEGDTAPEIYERIVGHSGAAVRAGAGAEVA